MKNINQYYYDFFTDFRNHKHNIVLCAHSYDGTDCRLLNIGYAICNPVDTYSTYTGNKLAYERACKNTSALEVNIKHVLSKEVVDLILKQQAAYIKTHPNLFIKGYKENESKYLRKKEAIIEFNTLDENSKQVISDIFYNKIDINKCINIADNLK